MSTVKVLLPVNDSLRVRYRVRLEDGTLLSLTGYAIAITAKSANTQAAPIVATGVGVVQNPDTTAVATLPKNSLTAAGTFYVTVSATNATESYSETFTVQTSDHA